MDAHRGQVFSEVYARRRTRSSRAGRVVAAGRHPRRVGLSIGRHPVFVGDGAMRYRAEILARFGDAVGVIDPPPLAGVVGQIAAARPDRAVLPHAVVPIYVRKPDAELARLRRLAGG